MAASTEIVERRWTISIEATWVAAEDASDKRDSIPFQLTWQFGHGAGLGRGSQRMAAGPAGTTSKRYMYQELGLKQSDRVIASSQGLPNQPQAFFGI